MSVKGWVYVIINDSLKGLVKIGYTLKDPKIRAKELQSSGIPNYYEVAYEVLTINPIEVEKKVHLSLKEYRDNKEWFKCSISQAIKTIQSIVQQNNLYEKIYIKQEYPTTRIVYNGEPESQRSKLEVYIKRQETISRESRKSLNEAEKEREIKEREKRKHITLEDYLKEQSGIYSKKIF